MILIVTSNKDPLTTNMTIHEHKYYGNNNKIVMPMMDDITSDNYTNELVEDKRINIFSELNAINDPKEGYSIKIHEDYEFTIKDNDMSITDKQAKLKTNKEGKSNHNKSVCDEKGLNIPPSPNIVLEGALSPGWGLI